MKIFFKMVLLAAIVIVGSTAQAAQVRVYDYGIDNFTNALNRAGVEIWDLGFKRDGYGRYFLANFYEKTSNKLIFRLNDDGTVASIIAASHANDSASDLINSSVLGTLLYKIGLNKSEVGKIWNEMQTALNSMSVNPAGDMLNQTFSSWCEETQRYIDVHCRVEMFKVTLTITAHA